MIYRMAGTNKTGTGALRAILWLTLPRKTSEMKPRPWLPITISE